MAFNHKFLATKSWNVHNAANIQKVAEAEALQASLQRRVDERKRTLEREKIRQQSMALLASASANSGGKASHAQTVANSSVSGQASSVAFLYEAPPGFIPAPLQPQVIQADELAEVHDLTKHEQGSAAAASAAAAAAAGSSASSIVAPLPINAPPTRLPGADGSIPADESYEDRRARHRGMSVQAVREELHPALRGAPVTAPHVRNMHFTAKPLGILLRDTRCVKCGAVGHSSTDRECPLFGAVDTKADQSRLVREDPLTKLHAIAGPSHAAGAAPASSFGAPSGTGSGVAGGKHGQFRLVYNDEQYSLGGLAADHPLQQVLLDSDESEAERGVKTELEAARRRRGRKDSSSSRDVKTEQQQATAASHAAASSVGTAVAASSSSSGALTPAELAFYSALPSADMKLLLRQLRKARDANDRHSSDSSSSTSSSDDDDSHRRKRRHKKIKRSRHDERSSSSRHSSSHHHSHRSHKDSHGKHHRKSNRSPSPPSSSSRRHKHHKRKRSDSTTSSSDDERDRSSSRRAAATASASRSALAPPAPSSTLPQQLHIVPAPAPLPSSTATAAAAPPDLLDSDLPPLEFAAPPSALLATLTQPTLTQQRA